MWRLKLTQLTFTNQQTHFECFVNLPKYILHTKKSCPLRTASTIILKKDLCLQD